MLFIVLSVIVSVEINKRHSISTVYTLQSMNYYKMSELEMTQVDFFLRVVQMVVKQKFKFEVFFIFFFFPLFFLVSKFF